MRQQRASLAKITVPRLFGVVARERLFACLDANRGRPLIWVEPPPGFAPLIASGAMQRIPRDVLRLTLDETRAMAGAHGIREDSSGPLVLPPQVERRQSPAGRSKQDPRTHRGTVGVVVSRSK